MYQLRYVLDYSSDRVEEEGWMKRKGEGGKEWRRGRVHGGGEEWRRGRVPYIMTSTKGDIPLVYLSISDYYL